MFERREGTPQYKQPKVSACCRNLRIQCFRSHSEALEVDAEDLLCLAIFLEWML